MDTTDLALPIKVDPTSNGEFRPVPLTKPLTQANALAHERIGAHAKRLGVGRRAFLQSLCAAATTLGTFNEAFAAQGNTGGSFRLPKEAAYESAAARSALAGDEFIFDVQTHLVDPAGTWRANAGKYWEQILAHFPQGSCGERDPVDCFSAESSSSTCLWTATLISPCSHSCRSCPSAIRSPSKRPSECALWSSAWRVLIAFSSTPWSCPTRPQSHPLKFMEDAVARYPIKAWKSYTQWGPEGVGWELDDPAVGIPFIEKARALGVRNICIHKGLFFSGFPSSTGAVQMSAAPRSSTPT